MHRNPCPFSVSVIICYPKNAITARKMTHLKVLLLALCCGLSAAKVNTRSGTAVAEKVLLTNVKSLTLDAGKLTTGRRSSPVPQLKCLGGCNKVNRQPNFVQCYNRGDDGTGGINTGPFKYWSIVA